jgi:L-iditol 2-dehydrogenase
VLQPNTFCGACDYCLSGKTNICPEKKSLGINEHGGFAEEIIVPSKYVIPVPNELSNERAVLIEPLSVIVHALKKVTITKDSTVAIIGCGTEGLLAVALASYLGGNITAIDINLDKLNKVKEQYPNIQIEKPENVKVNQFDVVIEVAGVKQSFEQGIEIVKPGGEILAIGLAKMAEVPIVKVVRKEITIKGSIIYNIPEDFHSSITFLLDSNFHVEPIISEVLPVSEYQKAYEMATSGKYRKILLKF